MKNVKQELEDMLQSIDEATKQLNMPPLRLFDRDLYNAKKGRPLTYGEVRNLPNASAVFVEYTDYHRNHTKPEGHGWKIAQQDGALWFTYGCWGFDVELDDFGSDDEEFDFEDEYCRVVIFEINDASDSSTTSKT